MPNSWWDFDLENFVERQMYQKSIFALEQTLLIDELHTCPCSAWNTIYNAYNMWAMTTRVCQSWIYLTDTLLCYWCSNIHNCHMQCSHNVHNVATLMFASIRWHLIFLTWSVKFYHSQLTLQSSKTVKCLFFIDSFLTSDDYFYTKVRTIKHWTSCHFIWIGLHI